MAAEHVYSDQIAEQMRITQLYFEVISLYFLYLNLVVYKENKIHPTFVPHPYCVCNNQVLGIKVINWSIEKAVFNTRFVAKNTQLILG
jgi:hypothetical protein